MGKIIITGGELFNKGAQAMTFITVDEMRKRFPMEDLVILSEEDFKKSEEEKAQYRFQFEDNKFSTLGTIGGGIFKWIARLAGVNAAAVERMKKLLQDADAIIDINGYALSSAWGERGSLKYLSVIACARKYKIPMYIMPQSFGPFHYKFGYQRLLEYLIKKYLAYPTVVYAREKDGYDLLTSHYGLKNVDHSVDLVLRNREINMNNVYKRKPKLQKIEIKENAIGILPNMRTFDHGNRTEILALYRKIISELLKEQKNIYLMRHAVEDIEICRELKKEFPEENVILLEADFSCEEYEMIVKKFEFLIASRYHSIVHAYKESIPCIVLGWAVKYQELLQKFGQEQFMFDIRKKINSEQVMRAVHMMNLDYKKEASKISAILPKLQSDNLYDIVKLKDL